MEGGALLVLTLKTICKKMFFGFADVILFFKKRKSSLKPESQSWTCNRKNQSAGCWNRNLHPAMNSDFDRLKKKKNFPFLKLRSVNWLFRAMEFVGFLTVPGTVTNAALKFLRLTLSLCVERILQSGH